MSILMICIARLFRDFQQKLFVVADRFEKLARKARRKTDRMGRKYLER